MHIQIHRGWDQIGGSIIEIGTDSTRIIFDVGAKLPAVDSEPAEDLMQVEGLTCGKKSFDAVFISHHHNDHCGLLERVLPSIPIYSGHETARILSVIGDFIGKPRGRIANFYFDDFNGKQITIGDMKITPIGVEHSAKDAYMFLIQAEGKNVLYTGDYRAVEGLDSVILHLLGIVGELDMLITEGTNIAHTPRGYDGRPIRDEKSVQKQAAEFMRKKTGTVFVLCSSTNEPRIRSIHAACEEAGRQPCHDLFLTVIREGEEDLPARSFIPRGYDEKDNPSAQAHFQRYYDKRKLVSAESLAKYGKQPQTIFVRHNMQKFMDSYLQNREGGDYGLIYSQWSGYKKAAKTAEFLRFCEDKDIEIVDIHCSGHAYRGTIRQLIRKLNPKAVVPVHCDMADRSRFSAMSDKCLYLENERHDF